MVHADGSIPEISVLRRVDLGRRSRRSRGEGEPRLFDSNIVSSMCSGGFARMMALKPSSTTGRSMSLRHLGRGAKRDLWSATTSGKEWSINHIVVGDEQAHGQRVSGTRHGVT